MTEYTGVWKLNNDEADKLFHRMKDFAHLAWQRNYHLACNPQDEALVKDMVDRLKEDDTWPHDDVPQVYAMNEVPPYTMMGIEQHEMRLLTLADMVNASKGLGRFKGLLLPRKGLHNPWRV